MKHVFRGLLLTALLWGIGSAQDEMMMPMQGPAAERLEQFKKIRLMEVLKLDEETSVKFFSRYNKQREELVALNQKRNDLLDELAKLRRANAAEEEYQKALNGIRGLARSAVEIRERFFDDAGKILTPKQMAEYLVFERNFIRNVREIMRDMQRERMRGNRVR